MSRRSHVESITKLTRQAQPILACLTTYIVSQGLKDDTPAVIKSSKWLSMMQGYAFVSELRLEACFPFNETHD